MLPKNGFVIPIEDSKSFIGKRNTGGLCECRLKYDTYDFNLTFYVDIYITLYPRYKVKTHMSQPVKGEL